MDGVSSRMLLPGLKKEQGKTVLKAIIDRFPEV
jgi:hypothetical protein